MSQQLQLIVEQLLSLPTGEHPLVEDISSMGGNLGGSDEDWFFTFEHHHHNSYFDLFHRPSGAHYRISLPPLEARAMKEQRDWRRNADRIPLSP